MRLLIVALVLTLAVAIAAATFAIWPVVADAPWEQGAPVIEDSGQKMSEIRCEAALSLRESTMVGLAQYESKEGRATYLRLKSQLEQAEQEIDRYC